MFLKTHLIPEISDEDLEEMLETLRRVPTFHTAACSVFFKPSLRTRQATAATGGDTAFPRARMRAVLAVKTP